MLWSVIFVFPYKNLKWSCCNNNQRKNSNKCTGFFWNIKIFIQYRYKYNLFNKKRIINNILKNPEFSDINHLHDLLLLFSIINISLVKKTNKIIIITITIIKSMIKVNNSICTPIKIYHRTLFYVSPYRVYINISMIENRLGDVNFTAQKKHISLNIP